MKLQRMADLAKSWHYAKDQGANVIVMRHAPKAGGDNSNLSPVGVRLAKKYSLLTHNVLWEDLKKGYFFCTKKPRTRKTLEILFPNSDSAGYFSNFELLSYDETKLIQSQVDELHLKVGRWRGYFLNHTYYFLEQLGGVDSTFLHTKIAERIALGIGSLCASSTPSIYCGHSPAIEVSLEKLLGISLAELGGFLNPLDSIHLKMKSGKPKFVCRINPIIGYIDAESEEFFKKQELNTQALKVELA